jgi:hypothetical protein
LGACESKNTALESNFEDLDALDSSDRKTGAVTAVFWNAHTKLSLNHHAEPSLVINYGHLSLLLHHREIPSQPLLAEVVAEWAEEIALLSNLF